MSDFEVATDELKALAKVMGKAGHALASTGGTAAGLSLPADAFGNLSDSGEVHASYERIQQLLATQAKKGAKILDGVDGGLTAVARRYSEQDASVASTFQGK